MAEKHREGKVELPWQVPGGQSRCKHWRPNTLLPHQVTVYYKLYNVKDCLVCVVYTTSSENCYVLKQHFHRPNLQPHKPLHLVCHHVKYHPPFHQPENTHTQKTMPQTLKTITGCWHTSCPCPSQLSVDDNTTLASACSLASKSTDRTHYMHVHIHNFD